MGFHNWITVTIGAFLNAMILGSIFTWGNLSVYVVAYLRNEDSPSVTEDDSYVVYTIMVSIFTLSEPLGSKLMVTIGGKWNMLIGCGLALCGIFFSALAKNIYVISITVRYKQYGALLGAGTGMMYCYPLKCAMDWNPEKKGIISGALLSGLGFGAFSWNMIATLYINPENKSAGTNGKDLDSTEYNRVPSFFLLIGGVYAVLLFIAHVILIRPSDFENQNKLAENEHSAKNFSFKETLMNKKFWLLWLFFIPISLGGTLTSLVFREIGDFTDPSDTVLSLIGSIGLLLESTSQILWGWIIDKKSPGFTARIIAFIMCGSLFVYPFISQLNVGLFALFYIIILIQYGGIIPTMVQLAGLNFGQENASIVYAMLETAETVAVILDFIFSNPIHHSAGLTGMYLIVGFISIGSVVIVILFGGVILKPSREIKDDARSLSTFLRQDDDIP